MFEFRVRQRSVIVWICERSHPVNALGEVLGLCADDAQTIAFEIAGHLHVWAAEEEGGLSADAIRSSDLAPPA